MARRGDLMRSIGTYLKHAGPAVTTCLSAVGVVATAVLAAKATIKAERLLNDARMINDRKLTKTEAIKVAAPVYIPAVTVGVCTIFCIFGANYLNRRKQMSIAAASALTKGTFQRYKEKVRERYGTEAHEKIMEELYVEKCKDDKIFAPGPVSNSCLDFGVDEERYIFHDAYSGRYFESTFSRVLQAEYHLNRDFALCGIVSLNDFFAFLGLDEADEGNSVGWSAAEGYEWIDFDHKQTTLEDGSSCFIIGAIFEPQEGFADW